MVGDSMIHSTAIIVSIDSVAVDLTMSVDSAVLVAVDMGTALHLIQVLTLTTTPVL